jgi:P pilus assembly chaperone PapD
MEIGFYNPSRETFNGMKRWGVRRLFLLLSFLVISFGTRANFMIYPISKDIHGGGSELIRIYSKSTDTQYIKIYAKRIINPGTSEESEVDVANWKDGMVITPGRLILPAGSSKSVRLTQVTPPATEEVYRVYFESVKPEKKEDVAENKSLKTDLSVNIIYAALVRALPENPKLNVNASVSPEKSIVINNSGNIRVGVKDIYFCRNATMGNDCLKKSYNKNIYPGNRFDTIVNREEFAHVFIETNNNESAKKEGEVIHLTIP